MAAARHATAKPPSLNRVWAHVSFRSSCRTHVDNPRRPKHLAGDLSTSARTLPADSSNMKSGAAGPIAEQAHRRVLFIINSLAGGGAERVMCTLLRASQGELRDSRISLLLLDRESSMYEVPHWIEVEQLDCRHSL